MFSIQKSVFGSLAKLTLQNKKGTVFCEIIPDFGANVIRLQLESSGKILQLLDGFKSEEQLRANEKSRGIHLAPFPNRIRDGKYIFERKEYQLPINKPKENSAIHGFIWNRSFKIIGEKCTEKSALIKLEYHYDSDYEGYSFPFKMVYQYELTGNSLEITVSITNTGKTNMPLGVGWHPYFVFDNQVDKLELQLPGCQILETDERLIPTGNKKVFDDFNSFRQIENTAFDTALQLTGNGNSFESKLRHPETKSEIIVQQDSSFPFLQIYIPSDRNSIAIEPMTCPANAFNSGEGLIVLKPAQQFEGKMKIILT